MAEFDVILQIIALWLTPIPVVIESGENVVIGFRHLPLLRHAYDDVDWWGNRAFPNWGLRFSIYAPPLKFNIHTHRFVIQLFFKVYCLTIEIAFPRIAFNSIDIAAGKRHQRCGAIVRFPLPKRRRPFVFSKASRFCVSEVLWYDTTCESSW